MAGGAGYGGGGLGNNFYTGGTPLKNGLFTGGTPLKTDNNPFANSPFSQPQLNYMQNNPGKIAPFAGGGTMNTSQQNFFNAHGYLAPHAGTVDQQKNFSQFYKPQSAGNNKTGGTGGLYG